MSEAQKGPVGRPKISCFAYLRSTDSDFACHRVSRTSKWNSPRCCIKMKTLPRIVSVIICLCSFAHVLGAQVPQLINYQGRVVVGTTNFDGSGQFKFALVNEAGTTAYWTNDGTHLDGTEPTAAVTLTVTKGLYSVRLGDNSIANMTALPGTVFTNADVRLRVWFDDGTHGSQLLTPDQRLGTVGYAFMADNIKDGAITSAKLGDGAVTSTKLGTGAVGAANIANGAVGTAQLANGAVTSTQLADNAVQANNISNGAVGTLALQNGAVTRDQLSGTDLARLLLSIPSTTIQQNFGTSVAAVGTDKLLIGAPGGPIAGQVGSAYLYDANTGTLLLTINNPTPAANDHFGSSVAAVGTDKLLIGAPQDDTGATDAGSAYLYDANTGSLLRTFNNATGGDTFGTSVAAVGADKLLIGAPRHDTGATDAGSAYLYDANTGTLLRTFNNPTPANNDWFGFSVAGVGADKVLIGAVNDSTGAFAAGSAYLYDANTGTLLFTINNPTPEIADDFGVSVAAVGADKVLIGADSDNTGATDAGSAYLYDANTGTLLRTFNNPTPASGDTFGHSVAAVGADKVLIGAYQDNTGASHAGSAYLYDANTGALLLTFNNPTPASGDGFGFSVAAVGADKVLIGANTDNSGANLAGSAFLFDIIRQVDGIAVDASNISNGKIANNLTTGTNNNTVNTLVLRDASGNFSAGTISANLNGNASTATNFTGSLAGEVTGPQGSTVVFSVGGVTAANVASGANLANGATTANTPNAIVKRDGSGNFSSTGFSGSLAGDVTGIQGSTVVASVGGVTAANVASGANLANTATTANTPNLIVKRDASGNFTAGTVTATTFNGSGAGLTGVTSNFTAISPKKLAVLKWGVSSTDNTFGVGTGPAAVCFDGANIWVANFGSNNVTKLDSSTGATIGTYAVGTNPFGIAFDGASIWVANFGSNNVTKLNASTGATIGTFNVGTSPRGICSDGTFIWVANQGSNNVTKLNAGTGALVNTHNVGTSPIGICYDGSSIWITNSGSANVTKLNATNGSVLGTFNVGTTPSSVCYDGSSVWVTNQGSANVTKLTASTGGAIGTFNVGTNPTGISFDGASIWVANNSGASNSVTRLNAGTGATISTHTVGTNPRAVCFDEATIWVTNEGTNNVTKL